ncbi:MAG: glycosyltransferase family 4 protein [Ilumatobacteraceae bacterium]|nr:glycosyltransferase family 4 protein [Ilumatobacter sp.]MCO5330030.1 glycosyltransferase family 4 protein [Ilumatobacteraceae bacterium]
MTGATAPRLIHLTTTDMSLDWLLAPQLAAFAAAGYEVVGASAAGPHVPALAARSIRHVDVTSLTRAPSLRSDLAAFVELYRLLRREQPTILHTHNPKPGVLGRIAGRLARVPVVVNTQHGLYAQPTDRLRRRLPVYALERIAAAFGHAELVQNPEDARTLVRTLKVPARKVTVLGNGIDLGRFSGNRPAAARAALRAEWGVSDGDVLVGVVGRLVREKGLDEIVAAARQLRELAPQVRIVVVGPADPDKTDGFTEAARHAAEADGVRFAGRRDDMPECYAAMDVFLTATHREGFPRAAMEASASGLPVVATDIRGCRQVVDDGTTGLLVPVRNPAALANAVARLAGDEALRSQMGAAGKQRAEREFDQQRVIDTTLSTYARLLQRRGLAAPRPG